MKSIHLIILEHVCEWFFIKPEDVLPQPNPYDCRRKVDLTPGNKAFALICWFYQRPEMCDLRKDARAIAIYFGISETHATKACFRDQYLHSEWHYRKVKNKVMPIVDNYLKRLYEDTTA